MFGMREAFTVGVVLAAKDMYSNVLAKAQRDIQTLRKTSEAEADKFTKSLATYQKIAGIGVAMTLAGAKVAAFWEDAVATAGRNQANMDKVMIAMGDSSVVMKNRLKDVFHDIKITWGMTDEAISEALRDLSGRLGDNNAALSASSIVAAFARARNIDLASSAKMLTTIYNQYGSQMDASLSVQGKFLRSGNQLNYLLKALGGDWETLNFFLGGSGLEAKAAGQSFETLGAAVKVVGMEGGRLRSAGASINSMLEQMIKIRKKIGWEKFFPTYRQTGNFIDLIGDIRKTFEKRGWLAPGIENQQKRLETLQKVFAGNAAMVDLFVSKYDQLKEAETKLTALGKETGTSTTLMKAANAQMETWDGTMLKFNARMEEFKEMLGEGGIPVIKAFHKAIGGLTEFLGKDPVSRYILGTTATLVGLGGEVTKFAGPAITMLYLYKAWRLQITLVKAAQASLAATTAATTGIINTQAVSIGALSMKNWGLVGALSKVALIGTTAFAGWEIGRWIGQLKVGEKTIDEILQGLHNIKDEFGGVGGEKVGTEAFYKENLARIKMFQKATEGMKETDIVPDYMVRGWLKQQALLGLRNVPFNIKGVREELARAYGVQAKLLELAPKQKFGVSKSPGKVYESIQSFVPPPKYQFGGYVPRSTLAFLHAGEFVLPKSPVVKSIESKQHGGYIPKPTLALLHPGEYVLPKRNVILNEVKNLSSPVIASAAKQSPPIINISNTFNLTSTGSAAIDAKTLARQVMRELNKALKFEARRYA